MELKKDSFGFIEDQAIYEYTLTNSNSLSLSVITYGGIITKIIMPNKSDDLEEITTNMTTLDEIVKARPFHGAIIGPVAGRISEAHYADGDHSVELDENENNHTLHSGFTGLDTKVWEASTKNSDGELQLILTTTLANGEGGFPGNIDVRVTYALNEENEIKITYEADTDKRTLFNPTNHVYFNLSGNYEEKVYTHDIQLNSNHYVPLREDNIPTGEIRKVTDTAFDLREGNKLGNVILSKEEGISSRGGLDHPFLIDHYSDKPIVQLSHSESGRVLEVETDCDAVVIYTHNHVQKPETGKDRLLEMHTGVTLETQQLPDAVNKADFGSIWLEPEEKFTSFTKFKFSTID